MSNPSAFPFELTERLKDEANAQLCRQALEQELAKARRQAEAVEATRPPFAFLSSRKSRDVFETSMEQAQRSEHQVRERLQRLEKMRGTINDEVREHLASYLKEASADFRAFDDLPLLTVRWSRTVSYVGELLQAFARDVKSLLAQFEFLPGEAPLMEALRPTVRALAHAVEDCDELAEVVRTHMSEKVGRAVNLPTMPALPDEAWLEPLIAAGLPAAAKALRTAEKAAREFLAVGLPAMLAQKPDVEADCATAQARYVERYWKQLREHTLRYHVAPRQPDSLLQELEQRFKALWNRRQQTMLTNSPFALGV